MQDQPARRTGDQVNLEEEQFEQQPERGGAAGEAAVHREPAVHQVQDRDVRGGQTRPGRTATAAGTLFSDVVKFPFGFCNSNI